MKIIESATGPEILGEFEKNHHNKIPCYCLLFRLSDLDSPLEARNKELIQNFIKNEFSDASGTIFLMNTSDIVFFLPQTTHRTIEEIKTNMIYCLSDILYGGEATDINRYVRLYDLGADYADCYLTLKTLAENAESLGKKAPDIKDSEALKVKSPLTKDPMLLLLALKQSYNKEIFIPLLRARPNRSKKIILIIEDQIFSQKILKNCIGGNYIIETAEDSIKGLKMYLKLVPDIVFLDWHLPDVDGIEFLKQIRKIDPESHVIMSTANNKSNAVMEALSNGAKGYITKPYNKEKIYKNLCAFTQK